MTKMRITLVLIFLLPILLYQNCSNVELESTVQPLRTLSSVGKIESSICAEARFQPGAGQKFVFIIDLSASNFGDWYSETLGNRRVWYWDSSKGFDPNGARFTAIENFLDNCSTQSGNQYAVIGFSASAGVLTPGSGLSCSSIQFTNAATVKNQIRALKDRQIQDESWYKQWAKPRYLSEREPDSLVYGVTSYSAATKCLEKLVVDDLISPNNNTDKYNVFFISDGVPEDKRGTGCNLPNLTAEQKNACYLESNLQSITLTRTAALSKAKNLTIQGIFYGSDAVTPIVLNAMSIEGGTAGVKRLDGFESNQSALCELVVTQHAHEYKPDLYSMINLNVTRYKGELSADSDGDGLSDEAEKALGYDPQNPRSQVNGVLDGICEQLGGIEACHKLRAPIDCNPYQFDKLGLSECDQKIIKLPQIVTNGQHGVDADKDGMPDYIEILKGTNPLVADMLSDPDQDGIINRDELLQGSDFRFSDSQLVSNNQRNQVQLKYHLRSPSGLCPYGEWRMTVEAVQTSPTLSVSLWAGSHAFHNKQRGEQTLLFLYRLAPMNSASPDFEYYYHFLKIQSDPHAIGTPFSSQSNFIQPSDFLMLGFRSP